MEKRKPDKYITGYKGYGVLFKVFFVVGILLIALVYIYYTQDTVSKLKAQSREVINAYARLWQLVASEPAVTEEIEIIFEEVIKKTNFPIIVTDASGKPQAWREVGIAWDDTSYTAFEKLKEIAAKMDKKRIPIPIYYGDRKIILNYLHYGDHKLINQLQLMPVVEVGVITLFIIIGFIGFRNIKISEQKSIWVGMARETAHQLGTPISSLLGWLELLKMKTTLEDEKNKEEMASKAMNLPEIMTQMESDVKRLEKIANRFGQIGSLPELKSRDLNQIVREAIAYYSQRLPFDGQGITIRENLGEIEPIKFNPELMLWVIENLIKNSLEAVDPKEGKIEIQTLLDRSRNYAIVKVIDNGKGILPKESKRIFYPGYTTKKRGWGLGLSLAKRIVEDYHQGKIYLEESIPNLRTVFTVLLPTTPA